jgi:hypothetical protein
LRKLLLIAIVLLVSFQEAQATFIPLTVKELDGSPSVTKVKTISVNGATLSDLNNGHVLMNISVDGIPASPTNSIQFNNAGAFGGSSNLTWNGTTLSTTNLNVGAITANGISSISIPTTGTESEAGGFIPWFFVRGSVYNRRVGFSFLASGREAAIFSDSELDVIVPGSLRLRGGFLKMASPASARDIGFRSNSVLSWNTDENSYIVNQGDIGLSRSAAGLLEVNSGTPGQTRDLSLRNISALGKSNTGGARLGTAIVEVRGDGTNRMQEWLSQPYGEHAYCYVTADGLGMNLGGVYVGHPNNVSTDPSLTVYTNGPWLRSSYPLLLSDASGGFIGINLGTTGPSIRTSGSDFKVRNAGNTTDAPLTAASGVFTSSSSTAVSLTAKAATSQTANLQEWQNNAGTALAVINNGGNLGVGISAPARKLHISQAMRLEPQSSPPTSPALGDLYVDSDTTSLCYYNGSSWTAVTPGGCS